MDASQTININTDLGVDEMGIIGIKKKGTKGKMAFVESVPYGRDKKEEDLHRLIAENPQLIAMEDSEGRKLPMVTIGSHLTDGEIDILLMDAEGNLTLLREAELHEM